MPKGPTSSEKSNLDAEFSKLFRAARSEHNRLKQKATPNDPAHKAAVAFVKRHKWKWAENLVEASRLNRAGENQGALELLAKSEASVSEHCLGFLFFIRGCALNDMRQLDEAINAYRTAINSPGYNEPGGAWNNLGNALRDKGELDEAVKAYRTVITSPGYDKPGNAWNNLGIALTAKGELDEAIKAYRTAINSPGYDEPGNAWYNLGIALTAKGELDEAIKAYRTAINSPGYDKPGNAWYNLGNALGDKGELDEAVKAYRTAITSPGYDEPGSAWNNLGVALAAKGELDEAIKACRTAITSPGYDEPGSAWNNLGNALKVKGELDEAIKAYRTAIASPGYDEPGSAWNNLGVALAAKGELDEAIKAYRTAITSPGYDKPGSAWYNLGIALADKGELDEAIKAYRTAITSPGYDKPGSAWNNLGIALKAKGELDEAIKAYRMAINSPGYDKPGNAWYNLGNALKAKGELDEAIKAYRTAINSRGYDEPGGAWNNLGNAFQAKGELDEAIKAYRTAINSPRYATIAKAWVNLAQAYLSTEKRDLARDAFKKALEETDSDGSDHARARAGLTMLDSELKPTALTPDDRAFLERPAAESIADDPESRIIGKVKEAGETQYEKYLEKPDSERDNTLSILRGWSSAVTLLEGSERKWRGGGYFLKWRGCGIVIDPGFDFLRNFHDEDFHGREISAVIVSHNHPDHNDDLKPIDDLRYEVYKRLAARKVASNTPYIILWDEDTAKATKFSAEHPEHHYDPIVMPAGLPHSVDLSTHPAKLPLQVIPFKAKHSTDVPSAMGMVIELLDDKNAVALRIGYTADTRYFETLPKHLKECDILIAHISQPSIEELQDATKLKDVHLGYRGVARLLKECQPKLALIGEFWAGYTDLRIDLAKALRTRSECKYVLPTGLGMHIQLPSLKIECTECNSATPFTDTKVAPPTDNFGNLAYLCPGCLLH